MPSGQGRVGPKAGVKDAGTGWREAGTWARRKNERAGLRDWKTKKPCRCVPGAARGGSPRPLRWAGCDPAASAAPLHPPSRSGRRAGFSRMGTQQKDEAMNNRDILKLMMGAMLFATLAYAVLAVPGLIFDSASTVPVPAQEARR